jgi:hypothetical protein
VASAIDEHDVRSELHPEAGRASVAGDRTRVAVVVASFEALLGAVVREAGARTAFGVGVDLLFHLVAELGRKLRPADRANLIDRSHPSAISRVIEAQ